MSSTDSIRILSLEAKDIYGAQRCESGREKGYDIRNREGRLNLRKFTNTLDRSLDLARLAEEYPKVLRRRSFWFSAGRRRYTTEIINVTFSYSYKLYNKAGSRDGDIYVRDGYSLRDCQLTDSVCVRDGVLAAVKLGVPVENPVPKELLGDWFSCEQGFYEQIKPFPVLKTKAELREYLYCNGFTCDGTKYVRYKRSSGSSRVGKCLFINSALYPRMFKWNNCGLKITDGMAIDLAAWEAHSALSLSSIIDTIEIPIESILLVEDYESRFPDEVVAVDERDGFLHSERRTADVTNNIWDGESLMDSSLFGKYADKGMLLLRNQFFKTCAFNCNVQQWFADNGITDVKQLHGLTLARDIKDVKLITTPSSLKFTKFGTKAQWLQMVGSTFGVVKYEKGTHFFNGRFVQCHYQLINSLELSEEDVGELLKPSLDYIGAVRTDPAVMRYHVGYAFKGDGEEEDDRPARTKNEIVFKMLGVNDRFADTKIYKDFRDTLVKGFYRNLRKGHVLINGNYSTMLGNGIELLQQAIGTFRGLPILPAGSVHTTRFAYGSTILGTRSPHILAGNVLLAKNAECDKIDRYFNLTPEIVYMNSIGENTLQRLNGADFDSDIILLTDNELLVRAAEKNYGRFKVPTNFVEAQKRPRYYTPEQQADLDVKTSVNKIGEIVNLSQQLNSLYWERRANGETHEECEELYNDICKLAVLSGIEIDRAKKEFVIDSGKEINILKKKYCIWEDGKIVKPMFFKMITKENGYELSENVKYRYFRTPMDYLQRITASVNRRQARAAKTETIPFMDIVREPTARSGYYAALKDRAIEQVKRYKAEISKCYIGYDEMDADERAMARDDAAVIGKECAEYIDSLSMHEYLMYSILRDLEKKENAPIKNLLFDAMFGEPNEAFMGMIAESRENIEVLEETDKGGTEEYYGLSFRRKKRDET